MKIVDSICRGGKSGRPNEDRIGHGGDFAWVIDGATGLSDEPLVAKKADESDAAWLAESLNAHLAETTPRYRGYPAGLIRHAITAMIAKFSAESRKKPQHDYDMPGAALAILQHDVGGLEIAALGDCSILVDDGSGDMMGVHGDEIHAEMDANAVEHFKSLDEDGVFEMDTAREKILPLLKEQRAMANTAKGYGVFSPAPACMDFIREFRYPVISGVALLMSDGFYALVEKYKAYDDAGLIKAAQKKGLEALYKELREIEDADPHARKYPRLKKSDDACAQLVILGSGANA